MIKEYFYREIQNRIATLSNIGLVLDGRRFSKVIIDEGFLLDKEKLAHLYYILGYNHIDVVSYGTI